MVSSTLHPSNNSNKNSNNPPSLNPNDHDPVSSIEKQYAHAPLGRRSFLILKLDQNCIVPGGVDAVMHSRGQLDRLESNSSAFSDVSYGSSGGQGGVGGQGVGQVLDMNKLTIEDNQNPNANPFDFLSEGPGNNNNPPSVMTSNGTAASGGGGRQFKMASMFAKAKNQLERGVTNMAVQAQKATGGSKHVDIRDVITIGAYVQDGQTGEYNICLGMTERHSLPPKKENPNSNTAFNSTSTMVEEQEEGITFQIPIMFPPHLLEANAASLNIQFKIYMRSNAAVFAKNRALRRYYNAGSCAMRIGSLVQAMQPKLVQPVVLSLPIQSTVIQNGNMQMIVIPDTKFAPLCGNGWSITDPRTDTGYIKISGKRQLYNPPLDQNYIYPLPKMKDTLLVTTERTTESTLVLPLATAYSELVLRSALKSKDHALQLASRLQCLEGASSIHDPMKALQLGHAQVQVEIIHFLRYSAVNGGNGDAGGGSVSIMMNLQRPDSIFENCIASGTVPTQRYFPNATYPQHPSMSVPFYPRIVLASDPRLLPGEATVKKAFHLGKLRFEICESGVGGVGADVFSPIGPAGSVGTCSRLLEAMVDIDMYVNLEQESFIQASVVDLKTGSSVGLLVLKIAANTLEGMTEQATSDISTNTVEHRSSQPCLVENGLISFVGLDTLMEDEKACYPHSDLDAEAAGKIFAQLPSTASNAARVGGRRKRQIATMGEFLTWVYMNNHAKGDRTFESDFMNEKFEAYKTALFTPASEEEDNMAPDKKKDPRPFRPSSSRMSPLLSSIGFNVHVQNFSVTTMKINETSGKCDASSSALFKNVTCGAPADHFKGFGKKGQSEPSISGGLRRLEAMRHTTAQYVRDSQDRLIEAIGNFYSAQAQIANIHLPGRSERHVSPSNHELSAIRTACIAATQKLHTLNWNIAVRRANVFSQALGIAITLYLAHVSDTAKLQKAAWAELWQKHGFLITFEGLLSAAGKELGMIEDAAVGINMLRMVSVVIVSEENKKGMENSSSCIPVPDSPYVKWVRINPSGKGKETHYLVEICVDEAFYSQQISSALKGNTAVKLYPMLYEMGVDIRQWGSNATNFTKSSQEELDDDEVGIPDNDVLIALNYEAFTKMIAYAHAVFRFNDDTPLTWEQAHIEHQTQQQIHPMLKDLYEYIKSSAGKMEHGILDEAAHAAAKLGGGAAIFCKSGKDRTAMQVTFKQSQFIGRFMKTGNGHADDCELDFEKLFQDATVMRVYGTRLPICDKNVGQSLYAFNSLQARFMPDALKPPPRTLAGFLKGGRVFSKEGIIES